MGPFLVLAGPSRDLRDSHWFFFCAAARMRCIFPVSPFLLARTAQEKGRSVSVPYNCTFLSSRASLDPRGCVISSAYRRRRITTGEAAECRGFFLMGVSVPYNEHFSSRTGPPCQEYRQTLA